ncbi:hypothetical protein O3M35_008982 [Rhynocoris fuscipes]|uniref:Uncharacterized protein n=1 Tax=Rhynocoris fuscipes TaxID=488301 RepID=A0AAW1D2P8_9HEMI
MILIFAIILLHFPAFIQCEELNLNNFPAVIYNPWFSYVMFRWMLISNPELLQKLLSFYPEHMTSYNGLAKTEYVNTVKSSSSTTFHFYHQVQNIQNSQICGSDSFQSIQLGSG